LLLAKLDFIQDVEPFLVNLLLAAKMTLQSPGCNTRLLQFVSRAKLVQGLDLCEVPLCVVSPFL